MLEEKLKKNQQKFQHSSDKEYKIRSIQYSITCEKLIENILVQSWSEYKYGIIYLKVNNIKLIFDNLINKEIEELSYNNMINIYKEIVEIVIELQQLNVLNGKFITLNI